MAVDSPLRELTGFDNSKKIHFTFPLVLFFILTFSIFSNTETPANATEKVEPKELSSKTHGLTQKEKAWLAQNHTIRARVGKAPPLHFFDGESKGISVDYLNLIARYTGLKIEYINDISWTDALDNIKNHTDIDIILTAKNIAERRKFILFTDDYLFMSRVIFTRTKDEFVGSIDDLSGKTISVENNYVIHKKLASEYPQIKILLKENSLEALQAVAAGEADAYIGNLTISTYILQKYNLTNLKIACPAPFDNHNQAFAIRNDWPELATIINKILHTITPQEHAEIRNNWLSLRYEYGVNKTDIIKWATGGFGFFGFFLVFFIFWNRRLKIEITGREQTEESLRESQRLLTTLMGNLPGMVYRSLNTPDWPLSFVSDGSLEITGYPPSDLITGSPLEYGDLIHSEDKQWIWDSVQESINKRQSFTLTYRIIDRQNQEKWVWEQGQGVFNDQDELTFIEGFITDITERKQAEAALLESEERYRTLFDYNPVDTIIVDNEAKIIMCNLIKKRSAGRAPQRGAVMYRDYAEKHQINMFEKLMASIKSGKPQEFLDLKYKEQFLYIKIAPFSDGAIITSIDTTPVKKLEIQLQQAQKMEAIGTLAGGIAHDFNNILGAIIGYTEMARDDSPNESSVAQDLDKVLEASERAVNLVKQILSFSRQNETEYILLQPAGIADKAITLLRPTLPTTIEITQDLDTETGFIFADPTQIHQILMNLCTNAFHAMEETGGKLDISLKEIDIHREDFPHEAIDSGTFVQLSVSDSGPGMTREVQDKIFDPYFTTKGVGKGTGMGLSIVHGIIKSYGGFITLSSEAGKGTAFHIYLPVVSKDALPDMEIIKQIPVGNERILYIDDEGILAEMGKNMLERLGYRVTVRKNGLDALETFQKQPDQFDIVITDQTMPGITGADLAEKMILIRPDIPIILCTGYSSVISEEKVKSMGIREFALKPLSKKDIAVLIRKVLDDNQE